MAELKGIKATDIHSPKESSGASGDSSEQSVVARQPPSPNRTPQRTPRGNSSSSNSITSRPVENFSRPSGRSPKSPHSPRSPSCSPFAPPPRKSSWGATLVYHSPQSSQGSVPDQTLSVLREESIAPSEDEENKTESDYFGSFDVAAEYQESLEYIVPHAITTTDDTAQMYRISPFGFPSSDLADVPEEEESFYRDESSSGSRPSTGRSSLRLLQSNNNITSAPMQNGHSPFGRSDEEKRQSKRSSRHLSIFGPALDIPIRSQPSPKDQDFSSVRSSRFTASIDGCWEDCIDFSYDQEAESSCNFDWTSTSMLEGPDEDEDPTTVGSSFIRPYFTRSQSTSTSEGPLSPVIELIDGPHMPRIARNSEGESESYHVIGPAPLALRGSARDRNIDTSIKEYPASVSSAYLSVPDLDPTSASTASTSGSSLNTPISADSHLHTIRLPERTSKCPEGFTLSPSLLIPSEYYHSTSHDALYEEYLRHERDDFEFSAMNNRVSVDKRASTLDDSPRSSRSPMSKCNSQESMLISRAASVVRKHRSSASSMSVPELVPSHEHHDHPTTAAPEALAAPRSPIHRRSKSLAKEVAHQSLLKRNASNSSSNSVEPPLPCRDRAKSLSDAARPPTASSNLPSCPTLPTTRRAGNRMSYSLFPQSQPRKVNMI